MSLQIQNPFTQFFDTDGSPLDNGAIYIGEANPIPASPGTTRAPESRVVQ